MFHNCKNSPLGKTYSCRDCATARSRANQRLRKEDPVWMGARRKQMNTLNRANKQRAVDYKGGKCFDCKLSYPNCVYDFHHLDGDTKSDNPSFVLKRSWEKAVEELDKCVMLCSNCHRIRHFGDVG